MSRRATIILCLLQLILSSVFGLNVSIYYEALCSDSVRFIATKLHPHYAELDKYLTLEFIPYGKATHEFVDGKWQFLCQHGQPECKGNKYHSCVLAQDKNQIKQVNFLNCVMRERNPSSLSSVERCANRYHYDVAAFKTCHSTNEGDNLLAGHGDKTYKLEPSISFVPTVVFDNRYDENTQRRSLSDFTTVVCGKLRGDKPKICANRS